MPQRKLIIVNQLGLHARAAARFVDVAQRYESTISVGTSAKQVDGKSIMSVMLLAASQGHELTLNAEGADAEDALEAITDLIADKFGEGQ